MYPYPGRICGAPGDIPWKPAPVGEGSKVKQKAINSRFHSIYGKNTFQVKPILTEGECLYVTLILQLCDIVAPPVDFTHKCKKSKVPVHSRNVCFYEYLCNKISYD